MDEEEIVKNIELTEMDERKVLGLLGISAKSGKVSSGFDFVNKELNQIYLLIVSKDIAENTLKKLKNNIVKLKEELEINSKNTKIRKGKFPKNIYVFGNMEENSRAIGKRGRAIIGIKDKGLAQAILKVFKIKTTEENN